MKLQTSSRSRYFLSETHSVLSSLGVKLEIHKLNISTKRTPTFLTNWCQSALPESEQGLWACDMYVCWHVGEWVPVCLCRFLCRYAQVCGSPNLSSGIFLPDFPAYSWRQVSQWKPELSYWTNLSGQLALRILSPHYLTGLWLAIQSNITWIL